MPRTDLNGVRDLRDIEAEDINGIGEAQGRAFAQKVKTSQLRAFYSAVNRIRIRVQSQRTNDFSPLERSLILLKPKLAYAAGRHKALKSFQSFMVQAIDGVVKSKDKKRALTNFFDLLEAVVAYHKFHGGKDN